MAKKKKQNKIIVQAQEEDNDVLRVCWFCNHDIKPEYKDIEVIRSFLSPRGNILSRKITHTCAKHQKVLAREIKIAREMALIR